MLRPTDISPLARLVRRVDAASDGETAPDSFATGFPSVDKWLGGGIRRGDLVIIGGEVGCGKSSLALAMALRMSQAGTSAAFFTYEMSVERVLERALAIEGRARIDESARERSTSSHAPRSARWPYGCATARPLSRRSPLGGSTALSTALRAHARPQVAFVDPLQAVTTGRGSQEEELAATMLALKALAIDLNMAVVVASHLRGGPDGRAQPAPHARRLRGARVAVKQHARRRARDLS